MSFQNGSFNQRFASMGDEAEAVFDDVYKGKVHALGLNRVWQNGDRLYMSKMTPEMKACPDRMVATHFAEVMGIGRDQTGKFKDVKMVPLTAWNSHIGPVTIFIYDSHRSRYWEAPLDSWLDACNTHGTRAAFHDGPEYWALHTDRFPVSATPYEVSLDDAA